MKEKRMYALPTSDDSKLDDLLNKANAELEKLGLKKTNRTNLLRALVFSGNRIETDILITAINDARTRA